MPSKQVTIQGLMTWEETSGGGNPGGGLLGRGPAPDAPIARRAWARVAAFRHSPSTIRPK
jgi:hypothetical protein